MPIPDYQKLMLPLLQFARDGEEHSISEAYKHIAKSFNLSEQEKRELLHIGKQRIIDNRVSWARAYLKKAGLLESTKWGYFRITDKGQEVLKQKPPKIDIKYLKQFPEFVEFRTSYKRAKAVRS